LETSTRSLWLVDAYNVLRVSLARLTEALPEAPAGAAWWSAERRSALAALAARLPEASAEICLVFDARHLSARAQISPRESQASPGGCSPEARDLGDAHGEQAPSVREGVQVRAIFTASADDWIVRDVKRRRGDFARTLVVTADRPLANRVRGGGAEVIATDRFVELCRGGGLPADPAAAD
jgi:predicted RNA-binding protein with PIN domain